MEQLSAYNPFIGQHLMTHVEGLTVDRAYIAHYVIPAAKAVAADTDYVLAATALDADEVTVVTTGITNPPTPRVLSVTGSADTAIGEVEITGTDAAGALLEETLELDGSPLTVVGTKAFATVTKITLPALAGADGETISVGLAGAFGLPYKLPYDTILKIYNGGTATTVASSSFSPTALASNYIVPTSALDPTKQVDVYLII